MNLLKVVSCIIPSGAVGLSAGVSLDGKALCGIQLPDAWVDAAITFQISWDGGLTWKDLYDKNDQEVTIAPPAPGHYLALNSPVYLGVTMLKVRSGTSAAPVDQTATRTLKLTTFTRGLLLHGGDGAPPVTTLVKGAIVRATGTASYAAGDVVGTATSAVIVFANCARYSNGGGLIRGVHLVDEANQILKGIFELWLFDTAITVIGDNAVWIPTDAEVENLIAVIEFQDTPIVGLAGAGVLGNLVFPALNINRPFRCVAGTALYGYLIVRNAYTPIDSEKFQVSLGVSQD